MLVMKWQYVYVKFFNETLLKTSVRKVIRDIKGYKWEINVPPSSNSLICIIKDLLYKKKISLH